MRRLPPDRALNMTVIFVLAAIAVATHVFALPVARRGGGSIATAGDCFRWCQRWTWLHGLTLAGWMWLGWHFFVRGLW